MFTHDRNDSLRPTQPSTKLLLGACLALILTGNTNCASVPNTNVVFTSPQPNARFSTAQDVQMAVSVDKLVEANLQVDGVEFFHNNDSDSMCNDGSRPYACNWSITDSDNGEHILRAEAYALVDRVRVPMGTATATVTVAIDADILPDITIGFGGSLVVTAPNSIRTITLKSSDRVGKTRVEFYDGDVLKHTDDSPPHFGYEWTPTGADNGAHLWTARAYDAAGNVSLSNTKGAVVSIASDDGEPPAASIVSPVRVRDIRTDPITSPQTVPIVVEASDNVGVAMVGLFTNCWFARQFDTTPPYVFNIEIKGRGDGGRWCVMAIDEAGNFIRSEMIEIPTALPLAPDTPPGGGSGDTEPPFVSIGDQADMRITEHGTRHFNARVGDNVGVTKVEFYDGDVLKHRDTSAPYFFYNWTPRLADNGVHLFTARAYDAAGNISVSIPQGLVVSLATDDSEPPVASIVSPALVDREQTSPFTSPQTVPIVVDAQDNDEVVMVVFHEHCDTTFSMKDIFYDTTPPFTFDYEIKDNSNDSRWCVDAIDRSGNITRSESILINVDIP